MARTPKKDGGIVLNSIAQKVSIWQADAMLFGRIGTQWLLIFSLLTPSFSLAGSSLDPLPNQPRSSNERPKAQAVSRPVQAEELRDLVNRYEQLKPGTPQALALRNRALRISSSLLRETQLKLNTILSKIEKLSAQSERAISSEPAHAGEDLARLQADAQPLIHLKEEVLRQHGRLGGDIPFWFLQDPNGKPTAENIKGASISLPAQDLQSADKERPKAQDRRLKTLLKAPAGAMASFSNQYAIFSISMGFLAMSEMQFADTTNPNAFENWMNQTFNLMGMAGFGVFMLANHKTVQMLQRIRSGAVPMSAMNYLGMTAGAVAQEYFHELWHDKDVASCLKKIYRGNEENPASCQKAYQSWVEQGKILQFAPSVVSMLGSTALASAIRTWLAKSGGPQALNNKYMQFVAKGVTVIPKAHWARRAEYLAAGLPGVAVAVFDFVFFLAIDMYVFADPVQRFWADFKMNFFDPRAFSINKSGLHSELLWPKEQTYQMVSNALDIEATNLFGAHNYLVETYRQLNESGWKKPLSIDACVPSAISEAVKSGQMQELNKIWFWQRWWSRQKSQQQLTCEVFARPSDLLSRYGEVNREWRQGALLSKFSSWQYNWTNMTNQFSTVYDASRALARHFATLKFAMVHKGSSEKPDLSREALAKVINAPLSKGKDDDPEKVHDWFLDGTWIPTPELIDYVVAGFACGADPVYRESEQQSWMLPRLFDQIHTVLSRQVKSPAFISTPYGSSLRFVPPKLTNKGRYICAVFQNGLYSTINYMTGDYLPEYSNDVVKNAFKGTFRDENGKTYSSLAEYVFENLDPEIYKPVGVAPNYATWWNDHLIKVIEPVWETYAQTYDRFVTENYIPVLFDRTYRYGCAMNPNRQVSLDPSQPKPRDQEGFEVATRTIETKMRNGQAASFEKKCNDSSSAYRVANGVVLAMEIELRNYLRGAYSLYNSTLSQAPTAQAETTALKENFIGVSNQLIGHLSRTRPEDWRSPDYEQNLAEADELVERLFEMMDERLAGSSGSDAEFRREMAARFKEQISAVLSERAQHAGVFHALEFNGSAARVRVNKMNSGAPPNSFMRP